MITRNPMQGQNAHYIERLREIAGVPVRYVVRTEATDREVTS